MTYYYYRTHVFKVEDGKGKEIGLLVNPNPSDDNQESFDHFLEQFSSMKDVLVADVTSERVDFFEWRKGSIGITPNWYGVPKENVPAWFQAWATINR